jgi:hypothetical protein
MTESTKMKRAMRTARSTERGAEILAFLQRPEIKRKLTAAVRAGTPPAGAISADLLAQFEPVIHKPEVKRRVGQFVAAILEELGFCLAQSNVRMKDKLFTTASVYAERSWTGPDPADLVSRLAKALTEDEARRMVRLLLKRFPGTYTLMRKGAR